MFFFLTQRALWVVPAINTVVTQRNTSKNKSSYYSLAMPNQTKMEGVNLMKKLSKNFNTMRKTVESMDGICGGCNCGCPPTCGCSCGSVELHVHYSTNGSPQAQAYPYSSMHGLVDYQPSN